MRAMALNIKNQDVERLVEEISRLTGESKTEAIRQALLERRGRLRERVTVEARRSRLESFLEREVWSRVPAEQAGRAPDRAERERILGYGPQGV
jgi:antitoxin VapB